MDGWMDGRMDGQPYKKYFDWSKGKEIKKHLEYFLKKIPFTLDDMEKKYNYLKFNLWPLKWNIVMEVTNFNH